MLVGVQMMVSLGMDLMQAFYFVVGLSQQLMHLLNWRERSFSRWNGPLCLPLAEGVLDGGHLWEDEGQAGKQA